MFQFSVSPTSACLSIFGGHRLLGPTSRVSESVMWASHLSTLQLVHSRFLLFSLPFSSLNFLSFLFDFINIFVFLSPSCTLPSWHFHLIFSFKCYFCKVFFFSIYFARRHKRRKYSLHLLRNDCLICPEATDMRISLNALDQSTFFLFSDVIH